MNGVAGRKGSNGAGGPRGAPIGKAPIGKAPTGAPRGQRLVALFGAACLLFNFPLLALFDRNAVVMGMPLLPVALFGIWAVLIVLLAWTVERRGGH